MPDDRPPEPRHASPADHVDRLASGLTDAAIDPQRYGNYPLDVPQEVATLLAANIPRDARVIDVGCGNGILSELMRDRAGCTVTGVEPAADRAAVGRARGIAIIVGLWDAPTATTLPPADAVTFMDVLEHLAEPFEALRLAREKLGETGVVIASVPNVGHWSVRLALLCGRFDYQSSGIMDATHLRWFTRLSFRQLFERAGFEPIVEDVSANVNMPFYQTRPWRLLRSRRERTIRWLARTFPTIFGVQLFIVARKRAA